ncbi:MAG: acylphosphatase [Bacteroidota bacterium]
MKKSYSIRVSGKVQGVGFRFYTHKKANELEMKGFVKNMRDGSVYIEVEGNTGRMDEFISWVQHGPEWARVDKLSKQEKPFEDFDDFVIR